MFGAMFCIVLHCAVHGLAAQYVTQCRQYIYKCLKCLVFSFSHHHHHQWNVDLVTQQFREVSTRNIKAKIIWIRKIFHLIPSILVQLHPEILGCTLSAQILTIIILLIMVESWCNNTPPPFPRSTYTSPYGTDRCGFDSFSILRNKIGGFNTAVVDLS